MNGWIGFFYVFINGGALFLSALGLWFTTIITGIDSWSRRFFMSYFTVLLLCCLSGLIELVPRYYLPLSGIMRFALYLESLLFSLPFFMLTVYLLHYSGENVRRSRLLYAAAVLWAVYLVLLTAGLFFDGFYVTIQGGQYYREAWYPLILLPMTVIMLLNLSGTLKRRKRLSRKAFSSLLIAILPMMAALTVQMFVEVFPIVAISIVLSALSMYSLILSDQIEQDLQRQREIARQQLEIANQRASIMVLQMRPHFIYNTMTSIYCLCNQDPGLARQVVLDFTTYLRKNFNAITSPAPIPFSAELEHTRAYLAVEKAQYEDSLIVDYDTPHILFRVPPLTLQPIVENAVKHGRDPYAGPFHILIRTRKADNRSEITVADNGSGFDTVENSESEPHIALKNIRQRLEIMCGGHLTITPADGGGTVVMVTIPDGIEYSIRDE